MLQTGPKLATWRLAQAPPPSADRPIEAQRIGDHRAAYLDYEGPVSGDRGYVRRVDRGRWQLRERSQDEWSFRLEGKLCRGTYRLVRRPSQSPDAWSFQLHSEPPASG